MMLEVTMRLLPWLHEEPVGSSATASSLGERRDRPRPVHVDAKTVSELGVSIPVPTGTGTRGKGRVGPVEQEPPQGRTRVADPEHLQGKRRDRELDHPTWQSNAE
jgi:hypothetical protein